MCPGPLAGGALPRAPPPGRSRQPKAAPPRALRAARPEPGGRGPGRQPQPELTSRTTRPDLASSTAIVFEDVDTSRWPGGEEPKQRATAESRQLPARSRALTSTLRSCGGVSIAPTSSRRSWSPRAEAQVVGSLGHSALLSHPQLTCPLCNECGLRPTGMTQPLGSGVPTGSMHPQQTHAGLRLTHLIQRGCVHNAHRVLGGTHEGQ